MTSRNDGTTTTSADVLQDLTGLSEEQIREYVARCPAENRWAFEGWLRGERHLDGDPIDPEPPGRARFASGWATSGPRSSTHTGAGERPASHP